MRIKFKKQIKTYRLFLGLTAVDDALGPVSNLDMLHQHLKILTKIISRTNMTNHKRSNKCTINNILRL